MNNLVDLNTLEDLEQFERLEELLSLASDEDTHPDNLRELSQDTLHFIRGEVACNRSTPSDVLVHLLNDEEEGVVWSVAENPNTPVEALYKLKDADFHLSPEADARVSEACEQYRQAHDLDGIPDSYIAKLMWG